MKKRQPRKKRSIAFYELLLQAQEAILAPPKDRIKVDRRPPLVLPNNPAYAHTRILRGADIPPPTGHVPGGPGYSRWT